MSSSLTQKESENLLLENSLRLIPIEETAEREQKGSDVLKRKASGNCSKCHESTPFI